MKKKKKTLEPKSVKMNTKKLPKLWEFLLLNISILDKTDNLIINSVTIECQIPEETPLYIYYTLMPELTLF